jgi:hypothetical protein
MILLNALCLLCALPRIKSNLAFFHLFISLRYSEGTHWVSCKEQHRALQKQDDPKSKTFHFWKAWRDFTLCKALSRYTREIRGRLNEMHKYLHNTENNYKRWPSRIDIEQKPTLTKCNKQLSNKSSRYWNYRWSTLKGGVGTEPQFWQNWGRNQKSGWKQYTRKKAGTQTGFSCLS